MTRRLLQITTIGVVLSLAAAVAQLTHTAAAEATLTFGDLPGCPTGTAAAVPSSDRFIAQVQRSASRGGLPSDAATAWGAIFGDEDGFGDPLLDRALRTVESVPDDTVDAVWSLLDTWAPDALVEDERSRFHDSMVVHVGRDVDLAALVRAADQAGLSPWQVEFTSRPDELSRRTLRDDLRLAGFQSRFVTDDVTEPFHLFIHDDQRATPISSVTDVVDAHTILCVEPGPHPRSQQLEGHGWRLLAASDLDVDTPWTQADAYVTGSVSPAAWPFTNESDRLVGSADLPTLQPHELLIIAGVQACRSAHLEIAVTTGNVSLGGTGTSLVCRGAETPGRDLTRLVAVAVDRQLVGDDITVHIRHLRRSRHVRSIDGWRTVELATPVGPPLAVVADTIAAPGGGAWWVGPDGGVFALWGAEFHGSLGNIALREPIVAAAPTATGAGYWLVASDGGVFAFGDAVFHGSIPGVLPPGASLSAPIVDIEVTKSGRGYWLLGADGGVFTFGDAVFEGSLATLGRTDVVGIGRVSSEGSPSYALVTSTGDVYWPDGSPWTSVPVGDFAATDVVADGVDLWIERRNAPALAFGHPSAETNPLRSRIMTCPAGQRPHTVEDPGYLNNWDRRVEAAVGEVAFYGDSIPGSIVTSPGLADGIWLLDGAFATNALDREQIALGYGTRTAWAGRQFTTCIPDDISEVLRFEQLPEVTPGDTLLGGTPTRRWQAVPVDGGWRLTGQISSFEPIASWSLALVETVDGVVLEEGSVTRYDASRGWSPETTPLARESVVLTRYDDVIAGQIRLDQHGTDFWVHLGHTDDGVAAGDVTLPVGAATTNDIVPVTDLRHLVVGDVNVQPTFKSVSVVAVTLPNHFHHEVLAEGDVVAGTNMCVRSITEGAATFGLCPG